MKTRPYSQRAVVGIAPLGVGLLVALPVGPGTLARFLDADQGLPGRRRRPRRPRRPQHPPTLTFSSVRSGTPRTVNLTIDYRGSVPATVQLWLPSGATTTSCVASGSTWTDGLLVGSLSSPWVPVRRVVLLAARRHGAHAHRHGAAQHRHHHADRRYRREPGPAQPHREGDDRPAPVGGFTDQVAGTITITTGAVVALAAAARTAPPPTTTAAAAAPPTPPPACVAAGLTSFAETVTLAAARPRFVAAEDPTGCRGTVPRDRDRWRRHDHRVPAWPTASS